MTRVLTNLRIDEVSAVDKGAGRNVKIVLMKRAYSPGATPADTLKAFPNPTSFNAVLARMEAEELAKVDDGDHDAGDRNAGGGGLAYHPVVQLATLLIGSGKFANYGDAFHHLLNTSQGAALVRAHKSAKEEPMDTIYSIMKSAGIGATCAAIVAKGSTSLTELEMVEAATAVAAERHPNMTPAQAFDKIYSEGEEGRLLRSAIAISKSMPVTPTMVGGVDATHEAIDSTESSEAYEQLTRMAEKMREASPELSAAQAFERVFSDKRNASLAAKAHVRPSPTTFFPMPR
jgi:hypothetical protein